MDLCTNTKHKYKCLSWVQSSQVKKELYAPSSSINITAPNLRAVMYSPRIYTYKITFEEVPYYYYGMHEEKVYDEPYWGSPVTNKWCWNFYTPKKQILEVFSTREDAYKVEMRLIKSVLNVDKWCLNMNCGGIISREIYVKTGTMTYELGIGIHAQSPKERKEVAKLGGKMSKSLGVGVHGRTDSQMTLDAKKSVETHRKNNTGCFDSNHSLQRKGGIIQGKKNVSNGHLQQLSKLKYICLETGFISSARGLSVYQKNRGICTTKRKLLDMPI